MLAVFLLIDENEGLRAISGNQEDQGRDESELARACVLQLDEFTAFIQKHFGRLGYHACANKFFLVAQHGCKLPAEREIQMRSELVEPDYLSTWIPFEEGKSDLKVRGVSWQIILLAEGPEQPRVDAKDATW